MKILVTGGNHELGGKDWDDRLISYLASTFETENGVNPLTDPHAHQELRTKAEATKKRLSQKMKDPFTFSFAGSHSRIEVTREGLRIELMVAVRPTFHLPALLAKQAANIDHISNGRLTLNVVSSWWAGEARKYGVTFEQHDDRYARSL